MGFPEGFNQGSASTQKEFLRMSLDLVLSSVLAYLSNALTCFTTFVLIRLLSIVEYIRATYCYP